MDFLTTARLLMDIPEYKGASQMRYRFEDGNVVIYIPVEDDVSGLFKSAEQLFEPID